MLAGSFAALLRKAEAAPQTPDIVKPCRSLERQTGGRLGVFLIDTATGRQWGYRSDERFMMLSSFKWLAGALVLQRVDRREDDLGRVIPYSAEDLLPWSPVTGRHADGRGMTLGDLCEAAITTSDNTAANLVLSSFGGPSALTAFVRGLPDPITRFDRHEPELNERSPDGLFDTTTPRAMASDLRRLLVGDALSLHSRATLNRWLLANTTGAARLVAGVPKDWQVGDKTGTNRSDANDVGILFPPGRTPWVLVAYLADSSAPANEKDAAIAKVGALAVALAS